MSALILGLSTLGAAVDLGKRIASQPLQIAAPKCPVADLAFRHILLSQMGDQIPAGFLQPREAAEFQFH